MNHLWQSTVFALAVALLALAFRKNKAQIRYRLWLAASVKFLIPFSLLVNMGSRFEWQSAPTVPTPVSSVIEQISQPFDMPAVAVAASADSSLSGLLLGVWFAGFAVVLATWWVRWRRIQKAVRAATPLPIAGPVQVMSAPTLLEPGVFGIFRPILLLPEGIVSRLTSKQMSAILAHELCHVRRRDNLAATMHMLVEAVFWFHPLVWWIGARMVEERERACDEEVLEQGNQPHEYANGILTVCRFYLESPLACASGVTGADLKKRIEAIMTPHLLARLTLTRKLMLTSAAIVAVAGPTLAGMLKAPQTKPDSSTFEVASVKPGDPDARGVRINFLPGGGLRAENVTLRQMIEFAYDIQNFQLSGGPAWLTTATFQILAKAPQSADARDLSQLKDAERRHLGDLVKLRLQALLAERFQLVVRRESKEMPVLGLVVSKNGHKLKESANGDGAKQQMRANRGELTGERATIEMLAGILARRVQRPVLDKTGLKGTYDFTLVWTPDEAEGAGKPGGGPGEASSTSDNSGPSIFTALQEQLGLKLESQKGPVEILVIERAEKPSAN